MERFNNILDGSPQSQTNAGSKTVLIAVMGMIGSGKSSFIQAATGIQGIEINQGLQPGNTIFQEFWPTFSLKDFIRYPASLAIWREIELQAGRPFGHPRI